MKLIHNTLTDSIHVYASTAGERTIDGHVYPHLEGEVLGGMSEDSENRWLVSDFYSGFYCRFATREYAWKCLSERFEVTP